ncbi:hypothetical protein SAY87_021978 [Trapa incisa]|uniref:Uncharacterized protein n=1 Tax=Trapa incisa TaxID=236973 RepID=A0AAN7JRS7_9MYRT|nr:hypothetical protein SAY87_021978 [Trapa incisa]
MVTIGQVLDSYDCLLARVVLLLEMFHIGNPLQDATYGRGSLPSQRSDPYERTQTRRRAVQDSISTRRHRRRWMRIVRGTTYRSRPIGSMRWMAMVLAALTLSLLVLPLVLPPLPPPPLLLLMVPVLIMSLLLLLALSPPAKDPVLVPISHR